MLHRLAVLGLCLAAALPVAPSDAPAQGVPEEAARAALIAGGHRPDGTHLAAVEIRLAPGWHTYWRMPGAAGIPPQFDWSRSGNLRAIAYQWPRPEVFEIAGSLSIGYSGVLVLPVVVTPEAPDQPVDLALDLFFGVCAEVCIPAEAQLAARLTADGQSDARPRIEAALSLRARSAAEAGVAGVSCRLVAGADGYELTAEITFATDPGPGQTAVIEAGDPATWIAMPQSRTEGRKVVAVARLEPGEGGAVLDRSALRVTVIDAARAVDIRGCPAPG